MTLVAKSCSIMSRKMVSLAMPVRHCRFLVGTLLLVVSTEAALAQSTSPGGPEQPSSVTTTDDGSQEKINMVVIYGKDACPKSTSDEITVCARKDEQERYRIPEQFRNQPTPRDEAWTNLVLAYETVGNFGTGSCSSTGPGGFTGCWSKMMKDAYGEKKNDETTQFSKLIEAARAKRLSTIDADAAKTQADVDKAEKEYDARQRALQDPASGDATPTNGSNPVTATSPASPSSVNSAKASTP